MDLNTDVLIIGAGPTGLGLACQLERFGVAYRILDKKEGTTPFSKALGVQARTLEIYDQMGLAQPLIDIGRLVSRVNLYVNGELKGEGEYGEIGKGMSPFPFLLFAEQGRHEKLLYEYLLSKGKSVNWSTEIVGLAQDADGVTATVKSGSGEPQQVRARYLVGCDGAKSFVRHALPNTAFEGSTFERMFYVADVRIDWEYADDAVMVCLMKDNILVFFPMDGEKKFRIVGTFPEEFAKDEGTVLYDEIEEQIKSVSNLTLDITEVEWFSTYRVHSRHVNRFSEGRCFLAGDSAHIHTPAGAQGMNTGIQDGYNLAWKLAFVLRGANAKLLDTYNEERLPNAVSLLKTTDNFFRLAASSEPIVSYLRMHVFPHLAGMAFKFDAFKKFLFPRISQIGINYRGSSLSVHGDDLGAAVSAGDRMPYFEIDGNNIYKRFTSPKFHLITFHDGQTELSAEGLTHERLSIMDLHSMPLFPHVREAFGVDTAFRVLLRPAGHIAMVSRDASLAPIENYFQACL